MEVLRELKTVTRTSVIAGSGTDTSQTEPHVYSHVDYITSLGVIPYKNHHVTQQLLISASHDGVIKLWK